MEQYYEQCKNTNLSVCKEQFHCGLSSAGHELFKGIAANQSTGISLSVSLLCSVVASSIA